MSNKKSMPRRLKQFIKIFILSLVLFTTISAIGTTAYVMVAKNNIISKLSKSPIVTKISDKGSLLDVDKDSSIISRPITTMAIFGVDAMGGYRTDVVMIAFFNHENMNIDIVSIPRDTLVTLPDDIYASLSKRRKDVAKKIAINSIPAYEEPKKRNQTQVKVLEDAFGVAIDYYATMDLVGFKYIVDLIGPVTMDVPRDMNYDDPEQDLYIHLKKGVQDIYGAQAEQLVRFRKGNNKTGYPDGDLGRIKMQHEFMKAFVKQALKPENKLNMPSIVKQVMNYVETDFKDAVDYLIYLDKIDPEKIKFHSLPGKASGARYAYDAQATKDLFEGIINSKTISADGKEKEQVDEPVKVEVKKTYEVKKMEIGIYNGTNIAGLASRTKTKLTDQGYTVGTVTNNDEKPIAKTSIIVPDASIGDEIKVFFKSPEVKVDPSLFNKQEKIKIILGETEGE